MRQVTRQDLEAIAKTCNRPIPSPLEYIVRSQEISSLKSPSVDADYYRFIYRLCQMINPGFILELGTHTGISAACFAEGAPEAKIITVNNKVELRDECRRPNVTYLTQDSLQKIDLQGRSIDILFSDTFHDGVVPLKEFQLYRSDMSEGGIIFFDDITLKEPMSRFWDEFVPPQGCEKFELPIHGWAGFGVVIMRHREA